MDAVDSRMMIVHRDEWHEDDWRQNPHNYICFRVKRAQHTRCHQGCQDEYAILVERIEYFHLKLFYEKLVGFISVRLLKKLLNKLYFDVTFFEVLLE